MSDSSTAYNVPIRLLPTAMPDGNADGFLGPWSKLAICSGEDPESFFPAHGDAGVRARQICANCPVRDDCREYAIQADEFGTWGGMDQEERRAVLALRIENIMVKP